MTRRRLALTFLAAVATGTVHAVDYTIDLGLVTDFEDLRPLVDLCPDLGELEEIRGPLESVSDLERLRPLLEDIGYAEVTGCPQAVEADGVERVR